MPAIEHTFTDALPARLYFDTDVLISVLAVDQPHHRRSEALFARLIREGGTVVVLSSLSWMEFANVVMRDRFRLNLPPDVQQQFRFDRWQESAVREAYLQFFLRSLENLLDQADYEEIALTSEIRTAALTYVAGTNLRPHDAVHLASASLGGDAQIVSFDESFRRIDGLHLWNDGIHAR